MSESIDRRREFEDALQRLTDCSLQQVSASEWLLLGKEHERVTEYANAELQEMYAHTMLLNWLSLPQRRVWTRPGTTITLDARPIALPTERHYPSELLALIATRQTVSGGLAAEGLSMVVARRVREVTRKISYRCMVASHWQQQLISMHGGMKS